MNLTDEKGMDVSGTDPGAPVTSASELTTKINKAVDYLLTCPKKQTDNVIRRLKKLQKERDAAPRSDSAD